MKREHWASRAGFILATVGSAIGLGNIWRFPYIVGENGGGAFLIPYFISIIFFGLPVMMLETAIGRDFQTSVLSAFKKFKGWIRYLGYFPVVVTMGIASYYLVIMGWTLAYAVGSMFKAFPDFTIFTSSYWPVACFIVTILLVAFVDELGVRKGIEKTCKFLMPILFVFIVALMIRALTLPGAGAGMSFYLKPDLSALGSFKIWFMALGQAFFSLSVGFAILITYGSYLSKKEDIPRSMGIVAFSDTLIAILGGFIIFPIVFSFGMDPAAGPELAFVSLPAIFSQMPFGHLFGALFFFILFIAAFTTSLSLIEVPISSFMDRFKWTRKKANILTTTALIMLGLPSALSYTGLKIDIIGMPFLDFMDAVFGTFALQVGAIILCVVFTRYWKPKKLLDAINQGALVKIPASMLLLLKYVIPLGLGIMILLGIKG